ncbi:hypothetical protein ACJX0J_021477, partial [Zea mays]
MVHAHKQLLYRSPMNRVTYKINTDPVGVYVYPIFCPPEDTSCHLLLLLTASLDEHFVKCSSHVMLYPLLARLRILCCQIIFILIHYKTLLFTRSWVTLEAYWEKIFQTIV